MGNIRLPTWVAPSKLAATPLVATPTGVPASMDQKSDGAPSGSTPMTRISP
ncbi:MAG: hypothetical protein JOZ78_03495 [Chroococcidiopsidaceae cyanobacterium CP_BM_ER_R8_30]|nr:hypothetical protein [Chroococcidiopsidaceae cyanobacterium CP_BM_ER_R8_30]